MGIPRKGQSTEVVLRAIVNWWLVSATRPTIKDIAEETGLGFSTVHWHVQRLVVQGLLHRSGLVPIGLRITYEDPRIVAARDIQMELDRKREESWYDDIRDEPETQEGEFRAIRDAWEPDGEP